MGTENENKPVSRKKFVAWGLGALSIFTAARFFFPSSKKKNTNTVKMLTQDGRLVEIDKDMIPGSKRKITDPELKAWVKNKTAKN